MLVIVLLRRASKDGRFGADPTADNPELDSSAESASEIPEALAGIRSGVAPKHRQIESRPRTDDDAIGALPELAAPRPSFPDAAARRLSAARGLRTKRATADSRRQRPVTVNGKNIAIWVGLGFGGGALVTMVLHALLLALQTKPASASPTLEPAPAAPTAPVIERNPQGLPWDVPPPPSVPGAE